MHASCPEGRSLFSDTFGVKAKWQEDNIRAKCYMLASMSGHLQFLHLAMVTAKEIKKSLTDMLGENRNPKDADLKDII